MDTKVASGVLRLELVDPAGHCTLDGPRLRAAADQLSEGRPPRVVLLTHPGPNFCVGGDVREFAAADEPGKYVASVAAEFHRAIRALVACPAPVISVIRGWAAGAGMSIVAASDIAIASSGARFRPGYPGIGFSPDGGLTWTLPRAIGRARAFDILLRDRVIDAPQALALGLVTEVVDGAELDAHAQQVAEDIATGPANAFARVKALINAAALASFDEMLDAEAAAIAESADHPEGREGVRAFMERRRPRF